MRIFNDLAKPNARSIDFLPRAETLDRWKPQMRAPARASTETVIDIYDVIGFDPWTGGGITGAWVAEKLKGAGDVVINVNSPGGDFFEGLAIYNLLRAHSGKKTVNIVGMAASAASLISAAGTEILIGSAAYVMIHNVWGLVVGDKRQLAAAAETFAKFDAGARVIYREQSKKDEAQIEDWMNLETWFLGQEAIDNGFATALLPADAIKDDGESAKALAPVMALRRTESVLCQTQGMSRTKAREIINQLKGGTPDATAHTGKHDAAAKSAAADGLRGLSAIINKG